LCTFQLALTLIAGNDGAFELTVDVVKLSFVVDDMFVKISIPHNVSLEAPIVHALNHIKEDSIGTGQPLKGFVDPMGERLCRVSCVLGCCINLADVGEVVRTIFL